MIKLSKHKSFIDQVPGSPNLAWSSPNKEYRELEIWSIKYDIKFLNCNIINSHMHCINLFRIVILAPSTNISMLLNKFGIF